MASLCARGCVGRLWALGQQFRHRRIEWAVGLAVTLRDARGIVREAAKSETRSIVKYFRADELRADGRVLLARLKLPRESSRRETVPRTSAATCSLSLCHTCSKESGLLFIHDGW